MSIGPRELHQVLLPAFRDAIDAGAASVMSAYNEIDGIPCSADPDLLSRILREQWGFKGFVVSDLGAIPALAQSQHVAADLTEAAALAINAGIDADLGGSGFERVVAAVKAGLAPQEKVDRAVARILRAKFDLGLFENPYCDPDEAERRVGAAQHRQLARQIARESVVLLKNESGLLPLDPNLPSLAVIGPNADSVYNQLGDYTPPQPADKVVTVLQAIRARVSPACMVRYAKGCAVRDSATDGFAEALDAVRQSQAVVVVMGGSSARDFSTDYAATGAARPALESRGNDMESGEGFDRATLDLPGVQLDLLRQVVAIGKPVVLVLIKGRPLALNWPAEHVPAILDAWYPGEQGGSAISDVLFGDYNPAGRLPISIPRSAGQLPVYYNAHPGARNDYADQSAAPLFAFGHGLSYTRFVYSNLRVAVEESANTVKVWVSMDVKNTGPRAGDEVVQLYLHDLVSSVTLPLKSLKAFRRIPLQPGESRTVEFELGPKDLALLNRDMRWVVEPGAFEVMAGSSSENLPSKAQFEVKKYVRL